MTIIQSIISGFVQGITEFLPVSSSGHLVIVHKLFGFTTSDILFDVILHLGTLLAVIIYFRIRIISIISKGDKKWIPFVLIGTIPAGIFYILAGDFIEGSFETINGVAVGLFITAIFLMAAQISLNNIAKIRTPVDGKRSVLIGIFQALALFPGISRSGATISSALVSGVEPEDAFDFSFILSIPIIFAGFIFKITDVENLSSISANWLQYLLGFITSAIVGLLCLPLLRNIIRNKKLYLFSIYCLIMGVGLIIWMK